MRFTKQFNRAGQFPSSHQAVLIAGAGSPFYAQSRGRGRPRADAPPRQLVDVGLDFSAVDMAVVPIEAIRGFELSNFGAVEVVVCQWVEKVHRGERLVGETLLRAPSDEVIQARRDGTCVVALLLTTSTPSQASKANRLRSGGAKQAVCTCVLSALRILSLS